METVTPMNRIRRAIEHRVLDKFVAWVENEDGPGIFTTKLRGEVEVYKARVPLPPTWQPPFPTEGVISEY
jgi:hypothetical protein